MRCCAARVCDCRSEIWPPCATHTLNGRASASATDASATASTAARAVSVARGRCSGCGGGRRPGGAARERRARDGVVRPPRGPRPAAPRGAPAVGIALDPALDGTEPREGDSAGVARGVVELLLDPEQLVVLHGPVGACRRAGLDLPAVGRDG